jgi:Holliday junction resolvase
MRAKKIDSNQREIVKALLDVGASVLSIAQVGYDAPDIVAGFRGVDTMMEIKRDKKAKLRPGQVAFANGWRGKPVVRVNCVDDAMKAIGLGNN